MSLIETLDDRRIWLQWLKRPARPARVLVWFPFGGGLAHTAKALSNALPDDWAMVGIEGPGHLRTAGEPITDINALADYYFETLRPLLNGSVLVGHSVGALIAGMVAQRLEGAGAAAEALVMGATRPPHTIPAERRLASMADADLFDWWKGLAVETHTEREERQLFELHRPMIRADLEVYDSARNRPIDWGSTPALLVLGADDRICPLSIEWEWRRVAPELRIEVCPGGHLFVLDNPGSYANQIVDFLDEVRPLPRARPVPTATLAISAIVRAATPEPLTIADRLKQDGMVLLRESGIDGPRGFQALLETLGYPLLPYDVGNSPRTHLGGHVYTSSEYSAALSISPHCELSYTLTPPGLIAFCCLEPAPCGGETILVRMDEVAADLPDHLIDRFADKGLLYEQRMTRGRSLGRTWPATLGTDDPGEAERILIDRGVPHEWQDGREVLVIWQHGPGVVRGEDGVPVWFNQADQWHRSTLSEEIRALGKLLPHDCRFGSGDAIDADDIATIRTALERNSVDLPMRASDVLLLDNTRVGHGRRPFDGHRSMLVALSLPHRVKLCKGGARWI